MAASQMQSPPQDHQQLAAASSANTRKVDANAQRLRENQRRSRLRKKEYLASLESRFRECQRTGIKASIEVQNAAKRVVCENVRLRELLRMKGISNAEIDMWASQDSRGGGSAVESVLKTLATRPCVGDEDSTAGDLSYGNRGKLKSRGTMTDSTPRERRASTIPEPLTLQEHQAQTIARTLSSASSISSPMDFSPQLTPMSTPMSTPEHTSPTTPVAPMYTTAYPRSRSLSTGYLPAFHTYVPDPVAQARHHELYTYHNVGLNPHLNMLDLPFDENMIPQPPCGTGADPYPQCTLSCDLARSMVAQMGIEDNMDGISRELCPRGQSHGCVVNTNVLLGVMDRAIV